MPVINPPKLSELYGNNLYTPSSITGPTPPSSYVLTSDGSGGSRYVRLVLQGEDIVASSITLANYVSTNALHASTFLLDRLTIQSLDTNVILGSTIGVTQSDQCVIAIGAGAGNPNQGCYSVAIGPNAGHNIADRQTLILNATSTILNTNHEYGTFIKPIRNNPQPISKDDPDRRLIVYYDTVTHEVTTGLNAQPVAILSSLYVADDISTGYLTVHRDAFFEGDVTMSRSLNFYNNISTIEFYFSTYTCSIVGNVALFVAGSNSADPTSSILYSEDTINYFPAFTNATAGWNHTGVATNGGVIVKTAIIASDPYSSIQTSTDGQYWDSLALGQPLFPSPTATGTALAYNGSYFLAGGANVTGTPLVDNSNVLQSTDGSNWTVSGPFVNPLREIYNLVWDGTQWLVSGYPTDFNMNYSIQKSTDGSNWNSTISETSAKFPQVGLPITLRITVHIIWQEVSFLLLETARAPFCGVQMRTTGKPRRTVHFPPI